MKRKAEREELFTALSHRIRRDLGQDARAPYSAVCELAAATEAIFDKGLDEPRNAGCGLKYFNPSDEMAVLRAASDRLSKTLAEAGGATSFRSEYAGVSALVDSALNRAAWENARTAKAQATAGYETQLFQPRGEIESFTPVEISDTLWLKWRSTSPLAAAGRFQVSRTPFPAPGAGDPLAPEGLVASLLLPSQGEFFVSWDALGIPAPVKGKLKNPHRPPDYFLRVVPLAATVPPVPAGDASNALEAYREIPSPPPIKVYPPDPSAEGVAKGMSRPLALRVDFECLGCYDSNEMRDEPYLVATGISSRIGCWPVWWPKPLFTGVTGTTGNWCPVAITPVGPSEHPYVVQPGEVVGFHVALCEEDNSDTDQVRAIWGRLGQFSAAAVTYYLTESRDLSLLAAQFGKKTGAIVAEIYESLDPDDFIGEKSVVWTYEELADLFWLTWENAQKAVHEGLQGFDRPWLSPMHQEFFDVGSSLDFIGANAHYKLYYSAKLMNPWYVGPYVHKWES